MIALRPRSSSPVNRWIVLVLAWLGAVACCSQPAVFELPAVTPGGGVKLTLVGPPEAFHRVDVSSDLFQWSPLDVLLNTGERKTLFDTIANNPARFYRAVEVDPEVQVLRVDPVIGAPGDEVVLEGQFFARDEPGENVVSFGGIEAVVRSATATSIRAIVPSGAVSGRVRVRTATGQADSGQTFTVPAISPSSSSLRRR